MTYDHMVKVNGKYYQAGEDVPEKNLVAETLPLPFSDGAEEKENQGYTKTDIIRMSTAELRNLAAQEGIEDASTISGGELKKILLSHFGL